DVTELAVHGSKAHVRHLVHGAQSLHDRFAYGAAGDFGFAVLPEGPLDVVDDILQHSQRNGPLFARGDQAGQQFLALKRLPPPVLFYDKKGRLLPSLIGGETPPASLAGAPSPDGGALLGGS